MQSSTAATVMTVSFVNAGLLTLAQAISVIMGANIGTTLTAWIMSAGMAFDITSAVYPTFLLGIILIYQKRYRYIGDFLIGLSFLLLGLGTLREISELESIGDSCFNMARTISRKYNCKEDHFIERQYDHLHQMMALTDQSLTQMNRLMGGRKESFNVNITFNIENEINNYRNQLKQQNIIDVNNHEYTYAVGTIYMDLIKECEKLGDYVVNVVEARMGMRQRDT